MVYRAKITMIQAWVESHYNINAYTMVHDTKDVYIEVNDEDEAELLESINRKQEELLLLKAQWYEEYNNKPKFKVGDKMKFAKEPKYPAREIIAIQNDAYYFDKLVHLPFSRQDEWELVEQKHHDKVEPKFKVGDYIDRKDGLGCHAKIIFVGGNVYGCEKLIHSEDESPFFEFMFKNQDEFQISSDFKQKPACNVEPKFKVGDEIKTANEESLTITKIDEKRYWSEDLFICDFDEECLWNLVEQKPAWSEEDMKMVESIITDIKYCKKAYNNNSYHENEIGWLKSIKDRIIPQPKQEWSEEDEGIKETIIEELELVKKSLDEVNYEGYDKLIDWLKSLRPQPQWKPSDEQMERLKGTINSLPHQEVLYSLYQDLKKLREE